MKLRKLLLFLFITTAMTLFVFFFVSNDNIGNYGAAGMEAVKPIETKEIQKESMEEEIPTSTAEVVETESFTYEPLPENVIQRIKGISWKEGSPVALEELYYVKVTYWGFDDQSHNGELIVHHNVAEEVCEIFRELYEAKFPIEKIRLIDEYGADDDLSMADNNTSAFCYRNAANSKTPSKHSCGIAIDINPVQNPYIYQNKILPENGKVYVNRKRFEKGMIQKGDVCYEAFVKRGWTWGGNWKTMKDYQHFQKESILKK